MVGPAWWATKSRRFFGHLRARVAADERAALAAWVPPPALDLFDRMHVADRRHGLDVVASLRSEGVTDAEVLLAGLLHDAGKGDTGVWPRVGWSLGQALGSWARRIARVLPGMAAPMDRLADHAATSARLAEAAGCTPRTIDLIRYQDAPRDPEFGRLLKLADEAN